MMWYSYVGAKRMARVAGKLAYTLPSTTTTTTITTTTTYISITLMRRSSDAVNNAWPSGVKVRLRTALL